MVMIMVTPRRWSGDGGCGGEGRGHLMVTGMVTSWWDLWSRHGDGVAMVTLGSRSWSWLQSPCGHSHPTVTVLTIVMSWSWPWPRSHTTVVATILILVTSVPWSWPQRWSRCGDGDHHGHRHGHPTAMVGWWWLWWRRSWSPHG